ncbi:UvrD-helicase domain-containing protein [Fodinisporobacter ferrooxydans]|uniref:DNA 3'-5' helicase n=1 Tax=Fodinisporobacter ferrooxydans TaxID=2901836 RepID=A0ABY4CN10_9BACL|nr:UvrD-helicase domain-containing protein [Alicyclobacillaceae bacterium MYW30-H2]
MSYLTESQKLAIRAKGSRILVAAGAGSGKTRVLTERISYLVNEKGISPENILALTFTDQAALEMKERVEQKLGSNQVTILTFHRFCGRIVRENPLLADVDPSFSLIDETTAQLLLKSLTERLLYESGLPSVLRWAEACGLDLACGLLVSLYECWREQPWDFKSIGERTESTIESLRVVLEEELLRVMEHMERLHQSGTITASGSVARMSTILDIWRQLPIRAIHVCREDENDKEDANASISQMKSGLKALFSQVTRSVAREAKPIFERLTRLKDENLWQELLEDQTAVVRKEILALLEQMDLAYSKEKETNGWCDFADLQRKAHHVLHESKEARAYYGKRYNHILVDEYQDTNPLQQSLLEHLEEGAAGTASLFMVGDFRQSIYRFRGADVKGFERLRLQLEKSDSYIQLKENFRSCPSLVAFASDMTRALFGDDGVVAGLKQPFEEEPVVEMLIPVLTEDKDPHKAEAELVARRILEMGSAHYGNIGILLQTRTHLEKYENALSKYGIPHVVYAGSGYWERQEVRDLHHLLRLVDDPGDELALLGYLRGPLVEMTDDGISQLARNNGLHKGFLEFFRDGESRDGRSRDGESSVLEENRGLQDNRVSEEDRERLVQAREFLTHLRERYAEMGLADWLYHVLYGESIAEKLGGTSFDRIVRLAEEAEKRGKIHLSDLLAWWEQLQNQEEKDGEIQTDVTKGAVRFMTIHAAKGLEFPIVIVPDLTHRFTTKMGRLHLSDTWGLTAQYYDENKKTWLPSLSFTKAREEERNAMVSEQKRLFYVAMTRAEERLIFSGVASSFAEKESLDECSNWFDWLQFLVPELREGLQERIVEKNGWKLQIRNKVDLVPRVNVTSATRLGKTLGKTATPHFEEVALTTEMKRTVQMAKMAPSTPMRSPVSHAELGRITGKEIVKEYRNVNTGFAARIWSVTEWVDILAGETWETSKSFLPARHFGRSNLEGHEWGHLLHTVLEFLGPHDDLETIRTRHLKAALAALGITSKEMCDLAWQRLCPEIDSYLKGELQTECRKAQVVYSELPFAIRFFGEDGLLLNGVIDKVWLRDDGGVTLVDFKTHGCQSEKDILQVVERYTPQVQIYTHVVEQLLGWKVDRAGLYLTATGNFVEVDCDREARDRLLGKMYEVWNEEKNLKAPNSDCIG